MTRDQNMERFPQDQGRKPHTWPPSSTRQIEPGMSRNGRSSPSSRKIAAQDPFRSVADVDFRSDAKLAGVNGSNAFREGFGLIDTHQIDRASGPARAREFASEEPRTGLGRLDKCVEGLGAVLEVVAAGGVGGRNEAAEFRQVAGSQGNSTLANPLVLGEHVTGALAADGIERVPVFRQLLEADVAQ